MAEVIRPDKSQQEYHDTFLDKSGVGNPYSYSWYLNIISPGWQIITDGSGNYLPITPRKKYGFRYLANPAFVQKLSFYSDDKPPAYSKPIIEYLRKTYHLIDININFPYKENICTGRSLRNYSLSLSKDYDKIKSEYSSDCRRNVSLSGKNEQEISNKVKPGDAINLFREGPGKRVKGLKSGDYYRLFTLMTYCLDTGIGNILGIYSGKRLIYSLFYIKFRDRITLLFTSTSQESRLLRSGYHIIDSIIKEHSDSNFILDFAGSSLRGVEEYVRSFGSIQDEYSLIYCNNLSAPIKQLVELKRRFTS